MQYLYTSNNAQSTSALHRMRQQPPSVASTGQKCLSRQSNTSEVQQEASKIPSLILCCQAATPTNFKVLYCYINSHRANMDLTVSHNAMYNRRIVRPPNDSDFDLYEHTKSSSPIENVQSRPSY